MTVMVRKSLKISVGLWVLGGVRLQTSDQKKQNTETLSGMFFFERGVEMKPLMF